MADCSRIAGDPSRSRTTRTVLRLDLVLPAPKDNCYIAVSMWPCSGMSDTGEAVRVCMLSGALCASVTDSSTRPIQRYSARTTGFSIRKHCEGHAHNIGRAFVRDLITTSDRAMYTCFVTLCRHNLTGPGLAGGRRFWILFFVRRARRHLRWHRGHRCFHGRGLGVPLRSSDPPKAHADESTVGRRVARIAVDPTRAAPFPAWPPARR